MNRNRYCIIDESSGLFFKGKLDGLWELSDKDYKIFNTIGSCKGFLTRMRNFYNTGRKSSNIDPNKLKVAEFALVFVRTL